MDEEKLAELENSTLKLIGFLDFLWNFVFVQLQPKHSFWV